MVIDDLWYKNAIIYCLDVEKYIDGNGDGIGDFGGLTRKLDYLAGLGVTCLWLQPFYPSPNNDNGYDVADYYGVHPEARHARRVRRVHESRRAARHARDRRSRRQPHVESPSVVPGGAEGSAVAVPRLVRLVEEAAAGLRTKGMVFPGVQKTTWTRDAAARRILLPSLLRLPAGSEHVESGGPPGDHADHGLLAAARRVRDSAWTRCRS